MRHYILYYHSGSANHGCEALVRTTAELLDYKNNRITLASFRPYEDKKYGIDKICDIHQMYEMESVNKLNPKWIRAYAELKIKHKQYAIDDLMMLNAISAKKGDVALSIGGDNYCYNDIGLFRANEILRRNGIKTVLWGCSIEPELIKDKQVAYDLKQFDLITVRESISYEAIKKVNNNTFLVSDSAFLLGTEKKPLPANINSKPIVGLNTSNLIVNYELKAGITQKNYECFIENILSNTEMSVVLIPHVVVGGGEDLIVNHILYNKYKNSGRVHLIEDCNCMELKGYISQCDFFVGARTHATIAAYSSCVPALALGYSVKSRGIAKDLFGDYENYVLPIQNLKTEFDLTKAFRWLVNNESKIRLSLKNKMISYSNNLHKAVELINHL